MATITIPKEITKGEELIIIPRREYEKYLELKEKRKEQIAEEDVLRWSEEAKMLKKAGKLQVLRSLKELR
ncbi:hypothetical protein KKH59_01960 [Patescibacteria group bacterium]|nr:hypothetical protein [Patescibacteria group bacterium]